MKQSEVNIHPAKLSPEELPSILAKVDRQLQTKLDGTIEHTLQPSQHPEELMITVRGQVMRLLTKANVEHFVLDLPAQKRQSYILKRDKIRKWESRLNIEDFLADTILEETEAIIQLSNIRQILLDLLTKILSLNSKN